YFGPPSIPSLIINGIGEGPLPFNTYSGSSIGPLNHINGGGGGGGGGGDPVNTLSSQDLAQLGRKIFDATFDHSNNNSGSGHKNIGREEHGNIPDNTISKVQGSEDVAIVQKKTKSQTAAANLSQTKTEKTKKSKKTSKLAFDSPQQVSSVLAMMEFRVASGQAGHAILFDHNEYSMNFKKQIAKKNINEHNTNSTNSFGHVAKHSYLHDDDSRNKDNGVNEHINGERLYSYHYFCTKYDDAAIKCKAKIIIRACQDYDMNVLSSDSSAHSGISRVTLKGTHNHKSIAP
ncbi:hypothetical protein RFI_20664, partial [Reticulomyxa filosa]